MPTTPVKTTVDPRRSFYEALAVLNLLSPTIPLARRTRERTTWQKFLDELCWLCDFEGGGKTVVSIAVESTPDGMVFWMAMNHRIRNRAVTHLKWVLGELANLKNAGDLHETERKIFLKSLTISRKRVEDYAKRLRSAAQGSFKILDETGIDRGVHIPSTQV